MPVDEREAVERAGDIRQRFGLGAAGIADIFHLLEDLGVHVVRRPMGATFDGAYAALPSSDEGIALINTDTTLGRQRFTAAHELGHHLLDRARVAFVDQDVWADDLSAPERQANAFAAALLMPPRGLRARLGASADLRLSGDSVVELMYHFGVSFEAMLRQLRSLGDVSADPLPGIESELRGNIVRTVRRLGYPVDLVLATRDTTLPRDYVRRALDAYSRGLVSSQRLAELLYTDEDGARSQAEEAGATPPEDLALSGLPADA